ncbi:MAG: T9SS type A sorting domain-containing protein [Bacteroidetes bacterium]|nr:T9SS type A sorting domain-containing protein [Bacteroidota bacterium]
MKNVILFGFIVTMMSAQSVQTPNPIIFVTQTPTAGFASVTQTFSNHIPSPENAPRGGDLMIRYPNGELRNLTREAGFGDTAVMQGKNAIAVRQPSVHWNGTKALFSMVIGSPQKIWDVTDYYWQIYEISGFGKGETAVITKVPNQPANYNNVSPIYGSDDRIIFTSDLPHNKKKFVYPQLDEYENARVVTGLWSLDRNTGELRLIEHSPSGSFYPSIDSYGRIIFTRWDHLQRDQQADLDRQGQQYGTFNYSSEDSTGIPLNERTEIFPEPRSKLNPDYDSTLSLHTFNQFFPWEINQDGTEEETVNHVGRHEFGGSYSEGSFKEDNNLSYIIPKPWVKNTHSLSSDSGPFHITEDPNNPGTYYAANAREFSRESAGQIIKFTGMPGINPEEMIIDQMTHKATAFSAEDGTTPDPNHSGHYRNPLPLSDGQLIVSHTDNHFANKNEGSSQVPKIRYNFRLKTMKQTMIGGAQYSVADMCVTSGIVRTLNYYDGNNYIVSRTDTLWELDPIEVRSRPVPPLKKETPLASPEKQVFTEEGVDEKQFRNWMKQNNLALIVSRNVTTRDRNDVTQPFNLQIPGGVKNTPLAGTVYDVSYLQLYQADLLRGQGGAGGYTTPRAGRRVLAQPMHDPSVKNLPISSGPAGSVKLGLDGSMASLLPAHRAMTWQLTDSVGKGIVRERYWITFQPGEIRTCASCHGINTLDQSGTLKPQNKPEALRALLKYWKTTLTSAGEVGQTISMFELKQNYPNPFNPTTAVEFSLPTTNRAVLKVYNMVGQEVATLFDGIAEAGEYHHTEFNASQLASGVYLVRLSSGKNVQVKKIVLVK